MGICDGRIVVVTGAGNGIGREHALLFGREGAKVVVNDLGGARDGAGSDAGAAQTVVEMIVAEGGEAVANTDNVATHAGAKAMIDQAVETFGDLHAVVNNAGILRDRMLVNMSEDEWDAVIAVHLKGTYGLMHHAAAYWRDQSKAGKQPDARIINTSSASGVFGNIGQSNYGAAKAGIAAMTIIASGELARYGITVNAISPTALTRMTEDLDRFKQEGTEKELPPAAISPLVVWLASVASAEVTGRVFGVRGGRITVFEGWVNGPFAETDGIWDAAALSEVVPGLVAEAATNAGMDGVRRP
ncbi:MAG TPA: SDR family oxidoreductase [Mycobacteriales bacterium]|jgi:NAD(P)-dependent dehydrogenase (short-subunit alcohol dehydrogenase family)|nr:SDR family oxidoreductase [Mycobacteriales bacterium]